MDRDRAGASTGVIRVRVSSSQLVAGALRLGGQEHHYLMRVRRARVGEAVELFDGAGAIAAATIAAIDGEATTLQVEEVRRDAAPGTHLTAVIPLLKGERMDQCVEKLVEVGCDQLVLWEAARSVVRLEPSKQAARLERIRAQVAAAVRQSGRAAIPGVEGVWSLAEVVQRFPEGQRLVLVPEAPRLAPTSPTSPTSPTGTIAGEPDGAAVLLSGPEGGLAANELEQLLAGGFVPASLTDTVLRAETAPVVAIAIWRWAQGR